MTEHPSVLCVGYVNEDEVIHFDSELEEEKSTNANSVRSVGGGAANTALILSGTDRFGTVYMAGCVGGDERGDRVMEQFENSGVEMVLPRFEDELTTFIRAFIFDGKKPEYAHENTILPEFTPDDIDDRVWNDVDHVHVTSFDADIVGQFAEQAHSVGATLSFNPTQGYRSESFEHVIEHADLVQMNRAESEVFRERNGPLGTVVDGLDTDVVITHGPAGCTMHSTDGVVSHPGFPSAVDEVVDTVGAGDSFIGGLLSAWVNDEPLKDCLKTANAHGAVSVTQHGAPNRISPSEVDSIIQN